eukprot:gb/GFBE01066597.1/.p1 GENE.gb/GFBE01066597.1/~~gb/GFBE01066597.1/.p1  ORF type:complete len:114 (+),score=22.58 gb/GFBE01066597.1/:1-342(+)
MIHLLNWIDYAGLGVSMILLACMALPPVSKKVVDLVNSATMPVLGCALYAFLRFQWSLIHVASSRADSPSCDDKVDYYRGLRNVYLDLCLLLSLLMNFWVASLKREDGEKKSS